MYPTMFVYKILGMLSIRQLARRLTAAAMWRR